MRWARGWSGFLPSLLLNSHVAEFIRAVLGYKEIRTGQSEQQDDNHCCKNKHVATPFYYYNITIFVKKGYSPNSTVMDSQYSFERDAS